MLQIESGSPSSGNRELDSYVDAVAGLKYAVLILALVALVLPGLITRRADYVALIVAASLISLAYIPTILYRRRAASVRALLLMLDGIVSSFALLIVLGLWSMARHWADNYWLYDDYKYAYLAAYVVEFMWCTSRSKVRKRFRSQVQDLQALATAGTVSAADLHGVLLTREEQRHTRGVQNGRMIALLIAPLSVGLLLVGALGGGDYFLYGCFVIACLVSPVLLAAAVARRLAVRRYFEQDDILIRGSS